MSSSLPNEKEDPRIIRTRNLILGAFMELLSEKGFQAMTVQDITERAGINRATFYDRFTDKYALLDYSINHMFRQEIEKRMLDACHYTDENLRALIIAVCEFVSNAIAHCKPANPQFESLMETQVKNQLQELLQVWLEQEESSVDSKTAAIAASWALYGLVLEWSHDKSTQRPAVEEYTDRIFPIIASSLRIAQPV
jgi:AcrR family transcriptional regulator